MKTLIECRDKTVVVVVVVINFRDKIGNNEIVFFIVYLKLLMKIVPKSFLKIVMMQRFVQLLLKR